MFHIFCLKTYTVLPEMTTKKESCVTNLGLFICTISALIKCTDIMLPVHLRLFKIIKEASGNNR